MLSGGSITDYTMTDINFYVGKQDQLDGRLLIACRLAKMAYERNLHVHIHTDSENNSQKLDSLLWTQETHSFLPHSLIDSQLIDSNNKQEQSNKNELDKITLSHEFEPLTNCDYLINLSNLRPSFFSRFKKMAEIIDQDKIILDAGRERYKFYRDRGYTLEYHKL